MAKYICVYDVFSWLLLNKVFLLVAISSIVLSERANILQRRSTVLVRKKKGDILIAVPPQAHSYYHRYYPISPIQFYPVPMPMVYRPMLRRHRRYRPPAHPPPIVVVIDEVTPFYNFVRRHLIPSYMKDLSRIAEMNKKTVYHYHPDHNEESNISDKHKSQKTTKSRFHEQSKN